MEILAVLPSEILAMIFLHLNCQKDRAAVDLVCYRYHEILRLTTVEFASRCNNFFFKITKVRFLVKKNNLRMIDQEQNVSQLVRACKILCGKYPPLVVRISNRKNAVQQKIIDCKIFPVSENAKFICYENVEFVPPAWRYDYINWTISLPQYLPDTKKVSYQQVMTRYNVAPDDLCRWFGTDQLVTGKNEITIGNGESTFTIGPVEKSVGCCCTVFPLTEPF